MLLALLALLLTGCDVRSEQQGDSLVRFRMHLVARIANQIANDEGQGFPNRETLKKTICESEKGETAYWLVAGTASSRSAAEKNNAIIGKGLVEYSLFKNRDGFVIRGGDLQTGYPIKGGLSDQNFVLSAP